MENRIDKRQYRSINKLPPILWLVLAYILVVLLLSYLNGFYKHLSVYEDEPIYYSMAEGLAKGIGFPTLRGEPYPTTRVVYSLFLAPAFLTENRLLQFRLIALINAVTMCSGAFPVYLLGRDVLKDRRLALLAGLLYLIQPDLEFTIGFMAENLSLPLALWVIYFSWKLTNSSAEPARKKAAYFAGWFLSSAMLVYVKPSGYVVVISGLLWLGISFAKRTIQNTAHNKKGLLSTAYWILSAIIIGFFVLWSRSNGLWTGMLENGKEIFLAWYTETALYLRCYLFTWASEILAIGIFPMILPILSYKQLSKETKNLFRFLLLLTLIANWAIAYTSIRIQKRYLFEVFPLYHRYIMYIWIPYLIVFFETLKIQAKPSGLGIGITLVLTALFCAAFRGAIMGSAYEASMLWWARDWMQRRWIWISIVFFFVLAGFILLRYHPKWFIILFSAVMLSAQVYNHAAMRRVAEPSYRFSYDEIAEVEAFIRANPDKTFLVVSIPPDINPRNIYYDTKIADTYLLYPNSYLVSGKMIRKDGINLQDEESILSKRTNLQSVDYVVLSLDMVINEENCEAVLENQYFTVFHLNDQTYIPSMNYSKWGTQGRVYLRQRNGFFNQYLENEEIGTPESNEIPGYVLYGPYETIPPGTYTITVHYSYSGEKDGTIGRMELLGSTLEPEEYKTPVFSDQNAASLSLDLDTECDCFQVCLYAEAAGIKVDSIEVNYTAPQT